MRGASILKQLKNILGGTWECYAFPLVRALSLCLSAFAALTARETAKAEALHTTFIQGAAHFMSHANRGSGVCLFATRTVKTHAQGHIRTRQQATQPQLRHNQISCPCMGAGRTPSRMATSACSAAGAARTHQWQAYLAILREKLRCLQASATSALSPTPSRTGSVPRAGPSPSSIPTSGLNIQTGV